MDSDGEGYGLKWDNHSKVLLKTISNLLGSPKFTDVTLYCQGRKILAHQFIISACSLYFRNVLNDHLGKPNPIIILDIPFHRFCEILQFMYMGEVQVDNKHLHDFLKAAALLQINGLVSPEEFEGPGEEEAISKDIENISEKNQQSPNTSKKKKSKNSSDNKKRPNDVSTDETLVKKLPERSVKKSRSESIDSDSSTVSESLSEASSQDLNAVNFSEILKESEFLDPVKNPNHECPVCGEKFSNTKSLKNHTEIHMQKYKCSKCNGRFSKKHFLNKHKCVVNNTNK